MGVGIARLERGGYVIGIVPETISEFVLPK